MHNVIRLTPRPLVTTCTQCALRDLCLPYGMSDQDVARLSGLVSGHRKVVRGSTLYRINEPFQSLFAIRSGFFKTDVLLEDGRTQVTGFQMAGELLGLDGVGDEHHSCNAVALEDGEVCVMPFDRVESLSQEFHALLHHLHKAFSREIVRDQNVMILLGAMRAEERLAAFILNLSARFAQRGYAASDFHLRMTRDEIGSYLGLKLETVSRTLSRFQDDGLISVRQKHLRILNTDGLQKLLHHNHA